MNDYYRFKNLSDTLVCEHAVSTKQKVEPYSFSVALHTGEDKNSIIKKRNKIVEQLGWNRKVSFVVANQIHSDHIEIIKTKKNKGWENQENTVKNCDALITNIKNVVLVILTADCVPTLLLDTKKNVVAAVHAGWRGSKDGILYKTIEKMITSFDCNTQDIIAGIGPAIGKCCYEVDEEVSKYFLNIPDSFDMKKSKYMLDLPYINKIQLLNAGLKESHIEMSEICTACEVEKFFSYRQEQGCSGRFMSMIRLL